MIIWCTWRTGQKEDFTLWKQHQWIPTLSLDPDWRLLVFDWNWTVTNVFRFRQNIFFIFYCSQFYDSFFFCFLFTLFTQKFLSLPGGKMRVKVDIDFFFSLSTIWARKLWKAFFFFFIKLFFMSPLHLQFLFMACHYLLQPFIPSPSLSFSPQYRFNTLISLFYFSQEC